MASGSNAELPGEHLPESCTLPTVNIAAGRRNMPRGRVLYNMIRISYLVQLTACEDVFK